MEAGDALPFLNVCTYSVSTLRTEDDLDRLIDEGGQTKWDVMDLCETYRKRERLSEMKWGYWMYEMDKTEDNPDAEDLAFLIHPKINDYVTDFKPSSSTVVEIKVKLQGKHSAAV